MTITSRTHKLLWSRAHDMCAICRKPLTEVAAGSGLVLGEEAHIIAQREDGPRGRAGDRANIDGYDNLILLCADDHKRIDSQPDKFSAEWLRARKAEHEDWASAKVREEPLRKRRLWLMASFVGAAIGVGALAAFLPLSQSASDKPPKPDSRPIGTAVPGMAGWCEGPDDSLFSGGGLDSDSLVVWLAQEGCPERALSEVDVDEPIQVMIWYHNRSGVATHDVTLSGIVSNGVWLTTPVVLQRAGLENDDITTSFRGSGANIGDFASGEEATILFTVEILPSQGCGPLSLPLGARFVGDGGAAEISAVMLDRGPCS